MAEIPTYSKFSNGVSESLKHLGMKKERPWIGAILFLLIIVAVIGGGIALVFGAFSTNKATITASNVPSTSLSTTTIGTVNNNAPNYGNQAGVNNGTMTANVNQQATYTWTNANNWTITPSGKQYTVDLNFSAGSGILPTNLCLVLAANVPIESAWPNTNVGYVANSSFPATTPFNQNGLFRGYTCLPSTVIVNSENIKVTFDEIPTIIYAIATTSLI